MAHQRPRDDPQGQPRGSRSTQRAPMPPHGTRRADAAVCWDDHALPADWEVTQAAPCAVDIQRRGWRTPGDPAGAKQLVAGARERGVSAAALSHRWLTEKVTAATQRQ